MFLEAENYFALDFNFEGFYQIQLNLAKPTTRRTKPFCDTSSPLGHGQSEGDTLALPSPLICLFISPFLETV